MAMERIIFTETTSIGIRRMEMQRSVLKREQRIVETPLGKKGKVYDVCPSSGTMDIYVNW